ncbi:MAG: imidazole glycerol phosphate synthase subunit HisH [Acidobacteriota bacterium]
MSLAPDPGLTSDPVQAVIVDAGVGNLGNLQRALERVGAVAAITDDPARIRAARCLLLPGVGAFKPPRERLRGALEDALRDAVAAGGRLLGICVGYQLLFESSDEFGDTDGLGLLPGRISRLPETVTLPQIGWNRLDVERASTHEAHPLLDGLDGTYMYFVHSFAPLDVPADACLARATHGASFVAVAGAGRVLGTQFHPEKSGAAGLRLLRNYVDLCRPGHQRDQSAVDPGAEEAA